VALFCFTAHVKPWRKKVLDVRADSLQVKGWYDYPYFKDKTSISLKNGAEAPECAVEKVRWGDNQLLKLNVR
jgi:hypothetical protein